jgi:3-deoxy-D-manno-octulosonic-acid transferase
MSPIWERRIGRCYIAISLHGQTASSAVETLARKLSEDGDLITIIPTLRNQDATVGTRMLAEPQGKLGIRAFLDHWKPALCVWVGGELDPFLVSEIARHKLHSMLVDATAEGLEQVSGGWVPGALKSMLSSFEAILALDKATANKLIEAGARQETMLVTGAMEDCGETLPCNEAERSKIAAALGTRPVWLASAARAEEADDLLRAHHNASRRAHRLLAVIVPHDGASAQPMLNHLKARGLNVALRSQQPTPLDVTQIYIIDTKDELGLWYRIAPITYLGGTLHGGGCRDPFEAASLGSAVLYGPHVAPYQKHAARLNAAGASQLIRSGDDLGPAVEGLLSADKAAQLSLAAWDITTRGANVTNRVADYIQLRLEELSL